jgi:glycerol-3-phosphate dehydrogenase
MKKTISILGCGWVGQALKESLELTHHIHCLSRDIEENNKLNKYTCNTLVIAIPPRKNYLEVLTQSIEKIEASTQVIFLSSTSFYAGKEFVVKGEVLMQKLHENVLILRLSGLMGYERIAGKYTAGKTKIHDALVNYVHRDDVVKIIGLCIEREVESEIFDVTALLHPKQSEVYAQNAKAFGWDNTYFESDEVLGRVISSEKLVKYLGYEFLRADPLEFW